MMTAKRVLKYGEAKPFQPFRLRMSSGDTFEVRHPEMISVGRTTATVFTSTNAAADQSGERVHEVSILLIESIEVLQFDTEPASRRDESHS